MSTTRESACEHPIEDYIWNETLRMFQCPAKVYDKGTVDTCDATLPPVKLTDTIIC